LSGIIGPVITGMIIDATGSYDNAFLLTAAILVFSALWWWFAVPAIRQLELD